MKIIIYLIMLILSSFSVFAQSLFTPQGGGSFIGFGIIIIVFFFVFKELFKILKK